MKVTAVTIYQGPNVFAPVAAIRCRIDFGTLEDWPTGRLGAAFTDALLDRLPGLRDHAGGFAQAMVAGEGIALGRVLAHAAVELQRLGEADVSLAEARPAGAPGGPGAPGAHDVVIGYEARGVGIEALKLAQALIVDLLPRELRPEPDAGGGFDFAAEKEAFVRAARIRAPSIYAAPLVKAAKRRGIPMRILHRQPPIIELGHGRFRKRLIETVTSDEDPVARNISSDKALTARILGRLGLPVPRQRVVTSDREAVDAAERIGYPVVVKQNGGSKGSGVTVGVADAGEVGAAFARARRRRRDVIVENFVEGDDHRMFVVDGTLIATAKRLPGRVRGDGVHTIEELVAEINRDPRRGNDNSYPLRMLRFDEEATRMLAKVGYTRRTVPPPGEAVSLRGTANLATGGTSIDMTDRVHPDNRDMAIRAAAAIGLTVAGIDFITPDIGRSYQDIGGAICEVNQAPGLRVFVSAEGHPPDAAGPVIDMLYPPGTTGRIPIAAITGATGAAGAAVTARMMAAILGTAGHTVGLATREGIAVDGCPPVSGDMTGPEAARCVLGDPMVDAAVFETAPGDVLHQGLGFDSCDVAAVLDAGDDRAEAEAMAVVVRSARRAVVLNADDGACLALADQAVAEHVYFVTLNAGHSGLDEHLGGGGRLVMLEKGDDGETIAVRDGGDRIALLETRHLPALGGDRAGEVVRHAMFAAAMANAMGIKLTGIRKGLCTVERAAARGAE